MFQSPSPKVSLMRCLLLAVFSLLLLSIPAVAADVPQFSNRTVPDFNVILNDDGDWSFTADDPQESLRRIQLAIDGLAGTAVKTYIRCVGCGSDVLYYPSKAASPIGWREIPADNFRAKFLMRAKAGVEAGIDPIRVSGERSKSLGLRFFPSYRMNDAHFAREGADSPLAGKFYVDNHERLAMKNNRLDFTFKEVREYRLAVIFEVLDRYQDIADGIELDFNRHGLYFPTGKAQENAPLLTEIVERVRQRLAEMEQKNGRPYYLIVRVSPTLANSMVSGMDVATWMRRRLVDVVVPAQVYSISHDMPIADMIQIARESGCKVCPAIYQRTQYTWPFVRKPTEQSYADDAQTIPNIELFAGASANYWAMGVGGFEMYNMRPPLGPVGVPTAQVLSSVNALTARARTYTITPAHGSDLRKSPADAGKEVLQYLKQLPTDIKPGSEGAKLDLLVGDDLNDPAALAKPSYIGLRIGLCGIGPQTKLRVTFNGQKLLDGVASAGLTKVSGGPAKIEAIFPPLPQYFLQLPIADASMVKKGSNDLSVEVLSENSASAGQAKTTIVEVQLGVLYDEVFPNRI